MPLPLHCTLGSGRPTAANVLLNAKPITIKSKIGSNTLRKI